jgi:hypothetical protein
MGVQVSPVTPPLVGGVVVVGQVLGRPGELETSECPAATQWPP